MGLGMRLVLGFGLGLDKRLCLGFGIVISIGRDGNLCAASAHNFLTTSQLSTKVTVSCCVAWLGIGI